MTKPCNQSSLDTVIITRLSKHADPRGWLTEIWRTDELAPEWHPAMGYVSLTRAGVVRGPHEHVEQADLFVFLSGEFKVHLWSQSWSTGVRNGETLSRMVIDVGEHNPCSILVPPGIIHAYQNVGATDAIVLNFPNRLYGGAGRCEVVDEIRHEDDGNNRYAL
jgi:dTDP-4-dehydrorhamnose 3,5-epimerase